MNRRRFIGSLLAVAAAPAVDKEAVGNWWSRLFNKPKYPTLNAYSPNAGGGPLTLDMVNKVIKDVTRKMMKEHNHLIFGDGSVYESLIRKDNMRIDGGEYLMNSPPWRGLTVDIELKRGL